MGVVVYTHTYFPYKITKQTAYLLNRIMKVALYTIQRKSSGKYPVRSSPNSYQKVGNSIEGKEVISIESVMRHVHKLTYPSTDSQKPIEKRQVKNCMQNRMKIKLHYSLKREREISYVHEGYEGETKRKERKQIKYFGGDTQEKQMKNYGRKYEVFTKKLERHSQMNKKRRHIKEQYSI